jgi:trk system potassium uptake protein TrkA
VESESGVRVAYLTRLGEGLLPEADIVYQDGDIVHVLAYEDDLDRASEVLKGPPPAQ